MTQGIRPMKRKRLSPRVRLTLFLSAGGRCQACGLRFDAGRAWHLDHVIPLSLGGADETHNLQVLCRACHRDKTRRDSGALARAVRREVAHRGARTPWRPLPCGRKSAWKKTLDGRVVRRRAR
jgi:5-methylcytosine-specific restriction protein A